MKVVSGPVSRAANILIVDDEQAARRTLAELLRRTGYRVTEAASGPEALEHLSRERFELVILDLKMPEMDGTEVLRAARPLSPDTVFIILTAYGTLDSAMVAIRHGAFDYLLKPCTMPEISRAIEAGLAERRRRLVQEDPVTLLERALTGLKTANPPPPAAPAAERLLQAAGVQVDTLRRLVILHGEPVDMTTTEFDILVYLLQHRDRVVSSRELVSHLRHYDVDERDARVFLRTHMHRLRHKLQKTPSDPEIISIVRASGYRIAADL